MLPLQVEQDPGRKEEIGLGTAMAGEGSWWKHVVFLDTHLTWH